MRDTVSMHISAISPPFGLRFFVMSISHRLDCQAYLSADLMSCQYSPANGSVNNHHTDLKTCLMLDKARFQGIGWL